MDGEFQQRGRLGHPSVVRHHAFQVWPYELSGCQVNRVERSQDARIQTPRRIEQRVLESDEVDPPEQFPRPLQSGGALLPDGSRYLRTREPARDPARISAQEASEGRGFRFPNDELYQRGRVEIDAAASGHLPFTRAHSREPLRGCLRPAPRRQGLAELEEIAFGFLKEARFL